MPKTCNSCATKEPANVPYQVFKDLKDTAKSNVTKWFIACVILIILLVGSNIGWLIYEAQFTEGISSDQITTQSVDQNAENGANTFVGGDMYGKAEDNNNND